MFHDAIIPFYQVRNREAISREEGIKMKGKTALFFVFILIMGGMFVTGSGCRTTKKEAPDASTLQEQAREEREEQNLFTETPQESMMEDADMQEGISDIQSVDP
jgi:hypothetical protein